MTLGFGCKINCQQYCSIKYQADADVEANDQVEMAGQLIMIMTASSRETSPLNSIQPQPEAGRMFQARAGPSPHPSAGSGGRQCQRINSDFGVKQHQQAADHQNGGFEPVEKPFRVVADAVHSQKTPASAAGDEKTSVVNDMTPGRTTPLVAENSSRMPSQRV